MGSLLGWFQFVLELLMNKSTIDLLMKILIVKKNLTNTQFSWKASTLLNGDKQGIDQRTEARWGEWEEMREGKQFLVCKIN